jgi:hypothetical protein
MATESARTEHLVQYAEKAWAAGDDTQRFAGNELRGFIQQFLTGAMPKGNEFDVNVGALRSTLEGIDERLVGAALDARDRDAWVKRVAEAFWIAGTQGDVQSIVPQGTAAPQLYTADEDALGLALSPAFKSGAQLADRVFEKDSNLATIAADVNCGSLDFRAGFYKELANRLGKLSVEDIVRVLNDPVKSKMVAQAFGRNLIPPQTAVKILDALKLFPGVSLTHIRPYIGPVQRAAFLNSLAADPTAAANFAKAIGPEGLRKLLDIPPGDYVQIRPGLSSATVNLLTAYLSTLKDPAAVRDLIKMVEDSGLLNDYTAFENVQDLEPPLKKFIITALPKLLGPVPPRGASSGQINQWVKQFGNELFNFRTFSDYINDNYESAHAKQQFLADIVTGFTVDWLVGLIPGGNVKDQALGNIPVVNPDSVKEYVGNLMVSIPESAASDPMSYIRVGGLTAMMASLIAQKRIVDGVGTPMTWSRFQNDPGFQILLEKFGPVEAPYDDQDKKDAWEAEKNKGRDWAARFEVDGQSLQSYIDNLDHSSRSSS